MTSWPPGAPRARRGQLAAELCRTRMLVGCPAGTWLRPPGSASPASPGPNADTPFCPGVTAWADATGITGDRRAVLLALAEAAVHEVATFRTGLTSGLASARVLFGRFITLPVFRPSRASTVR